MTEEITNTIKTLTNTVSKDGKTKYQNITQIKTYWRNMNPYTKRGLILYSFISIICFGTYNYQDGKQSLLTFRKFKSNCTPAEEIKAITNGINSCSNFFSALFFPYSIVSKIIPNIIVLINPKLTS